MRKKTLARAGPLFMLALFALLIAAPVLSADSNPAQMVPTTTTADMALANGGSVLKMPYVGSCNNCHYANDSRVLASAVPAASHYSAFPTTLSSADHNCEQAAFAACLIRPSSSVNGRIFALNTG